MIRRLDCELIESQAAQGIIGSEFMLDQESFAVFSGPYPFDNPPSLLESADDPALGKHATEDGQTDADMDILGPLSNVDAQEPRRPAPSDSAHRTSSYAPGYLPDCPGRHTPPLHGPQSTPTRRQALQHTTLWPMGPSVRPNRGRSRSR